jgi:hypothetical protein
MQQLQSARSGGKSIVAGTPTTGLIDTAVGVLN